MLRQLRQRLEAIGPLAEDNLRGDAAVLIPITDEAEPRVILTVRATHMNTHAGEVAFPGGKRDVEDRDLIHTVLRESREEIGLDPAQVEIIGVGRRRRSRFGLQVQPFVGVVDAAARFEPNREELDAVFSVPLAYFLERRNLRIEGIERDGRIRDMPGYEWQSGRRVWGLTAIMLIDILNVVYDFGVEIRR